MQILLTEEEYNRLNKAAKEMENGARETIANLCQRVCDHEPSFTGWGENTHEAVPWGCIRSEGGDIGCCDECPVERICTYDSKEYSK